MYFFFTDARHFTTRLYKTKKAPLPQQERPLTNQTNNYEISINLFVFCCDTSFLGSVTFKIPSW